MNGGHGPKNSGLPAVLERQTLSAKGTERRRVIRSTRTICLMQINSREKMNRLSRGNNEKKI